MLVLLVWNPNLVRLAACEGQIMMSSKMLETLYRHYNCCWDKIKIFINL